MVPPVAYCTMDARPVTPPPIMLLGIRKSSQPKTYIDSPRVMTEYSLSPIQKPFLFCVMFLLFSDINTCLYLFKAFTVNIVGRRNSHEGPRVDLFYHPCQIRKLLLVYDNKQDILVLLGIPAFSLDEGDAPVHVFDDMIGYD